MNMMKKLTALTLAVLMMLTMISIPAMAAIHTTVKTTNKGDTLALRKGPHKGNTPIVGYVKNGTKIELLSTDDDDDGEAWNKVRVTANGNVGYLKNKYIKYFGLSNAGGELDKHEDDDWDFSNSGDNDGHGSGSTSGGSSGSGTSSTSLKFAVVACRVGGSVNIRSGAGTGHKVVGSGRNGDRMHVSGKNGSWYKVSFANKSISGYIHSDYVTEGFPGQVVANGVNMRKGGGTSYATIQKLGRGDKIRILSHGSSWSHIIVNGTKGWIFSKYIEET